MPLRVHGAFVRDREVHDVVNDWKARGRPEYIDNITRGGDDGEGGSSVSGKIWIRCSIRRYNSSQKNSGSPFPVFSVSSASVITGRRGSWKKWKNRALSVNGP